MPDPKGLEQEVIEKGVRRRVAVLKDIAFRDFTHTALIAEKDPEQRKYRRRVVKVGIDPHTSYANMLCDVAWSRAHGTTQFLMSADKEALVTDRARAVEKAMPGLPKEVLAMIDSTPTGTCGRCTAFKAGRCTERELLVGARDPACILYIEMEAPPA